MAEHTPLPWESEQFDDGFAVIGPKGSAAAPADPEGQRIIANMIDDSEESWENAEFIVRACNAHELRACNAHEPLVAQLQRWLDWWNGDADADDSVPALISETKAVLKEAKGDSDAG